MCLHCIDVFPTCYLSEFKTFYYFCSFLMDEKGDDEKAWHEWNVRGSVLPEPLRQSIKIRTMRPTTTTITIFMVLVMEMFYCNLMIPPCLFYWKEGTLSLCIVLWRTFRPMKEQFFSRWNKFTLFGRNIVWQKFVLHLIHTFFSGNFDRCKCFQFKIPITKKTIFQQLLHRPLWQTDSSKLEICHFSCLAVLK